MMDDLVAALNKLIPSAEKIQDLAVNKWGLGSPPKPHALTAT